MLKEKGSQKQWPCFCCAASCIVLDFLLSSPKRKYRFPVGDVLYNNDLQAMVDPRSQRDAQVW